MPLAAELTLWAGIFQCNDLIVANEGRALGTLLVGPGRGSQYELPMIALDFRHSERLLASNARFRELQPIWGSVLVLAAKLLPKS
jgi:hypothetical protein